MKMLRSFLMLESTHTVLFQQIRRLSVYAIDEIDNDAPWFGSLVHGGGQLPAKRSIFQQLPRRRRQTRKSATVVTRGSSGKCFRFPVISFALTCFATSKNFLSSSSANGLSSDSAAARP